MITAAALVAAFALANPVHATSRNEWGDPSGLFLHAWQWLAGALPGAGERGRSGPGADARHPLTKEGAGVDPQGVPRQGDALGTSSPAQSDGGAGVDPNG